MNGHTSNSVLRAAFKSQYKAAYWQYLRRDSVKEYTDREYFQGQMASLETLSISLALDINWESFKAETETEFRKKGLLS